MAETGAPRVRVGRIGRPHGVRGEVTVLPEGDDRTPFAVGSVLETDYGPSLIVRGARRYRDRGLVVGFEGVGDRTAAEALRGTHLWAAAESRRLLGEGEYWGSDLVGLTAVAPDGTPLGTVSGVESGVGQDRLVVTLPGGAEVLVPFVAALVGDPGDGVIEIRDPGGLFPPIS